MSSSLLLDNFVIQDQHQSIQMQDERTQLSPITYHFYKEHEQELYEETSKYLPPISHTTPKNPAVLKKCNCCPYGYHIDLDFIRYCEELATNGKQPSSKQIDRRNKRLQRKSLEVMLGFEEQWMLDFGKDLLHPSKQHKSEFQTVYEIIDDLQQKTSLSYENSESTRQRNRQAIREHPVRTHEIKLHVEQNEFADNILSDAYSEFERTLERASTRNRKSDKAKSSCLSGDDTYGNEKPFDLVSSHYPARSSTAGHHSSTQYGRKINAENVHQQNVFIKEIHEKTIEHITETNQVDSHRSNQHAIESTSNAYTNEIFNIEIDKLALANRNLGDQLQSVRNQLSDNLNRVRDFEERVKLIPKLQLELSVEKAENRDLHLKLKALESALEKSEQHDRRASEMVQSKNIDSSTITTETFTSVLKENIAPKPFNAQRVCATSLESLNIRFPNSSSPNELQQPQQSHTIATASIKVPPCTHNVGCMTTKVLSRDVGVVTIPEAKVPTRTMAINTDINALNLFEQTQKKPIMISVHTQSDHEARIRTRSIATATDREPSPPPPSPPVEKRSVAIMAIPSVRSNFCMARPDVRSVGTGNIYQPPRTRSFGTDPITHLIETKPADSPISLKLLDAPTTAPQQPAIEPDAKPIEKPKEFRSMGVQFSPNVSNKFSQCKEKPVEPPPEVRKHTESTDTSDLILHIHRGINTDAAPSKKDRPMNTDRIITEEKFTNTVAESRNTINSSTNTDEVEVVSASKFQKNENSNESIHLDEHKCHNCLAKIEIKQRTIIKNPNKLQDVSANIITNNSTTTTSTTTNTSTTVETHNEELLNSMQQTDLQSRIPRPTALISPRSDKKFTRQNTYTIPSSSLPSPTSYMEHSTAAAQCPAEAYLSSCGAASTTVTSVSKSSTSTTKTHKNISQTSTNRSFNVEDRTFGESTTMSADGSADGTGSSDASKRAREMVATSAVSTTSGTVGKTHSEDDEPKLWSHSMKSSSTYSQLASSQRPRQKVSPSKEMQAALKVINDSLLKGQHLATTLKNANKIVQKEWFRISSTENAQPFEVEDYLDCFEEYSPNLLKYLVNLTDANGNTAMHYAVSHGNFDVVSILLDSKVCNINNTNNAGYTCVMLVSLAQLDAAETPVVQRLFQIADVNVRAKKHSQTALMLATSHGNFNMVRLLLESGADINIQDEDGSTALMCAAEHGRMDIIKLLLAHQDCDSTIQDLDGSTALKISLEAGYRDIGVLLYAHEHMIKNKSPYTSLRSGQRSRKASSSLSSSTNVLHGHISSNSNIASSANASELTNIDSSKHIS